MCVPVGLFVCNTACDQCVHTPTVSRITSALCTLLFKLCTSQCHIQSLGYRYKLFLLLEVQRKCPEFRYLVPVGSKKSYCCSVVPLYFYLSYMQPFKYAFFPLKCLQVWWIAVEHSYTSFQDTSSVGQPAIWTFGTLPFLCIQIHFHCLD